MKIITGLRVCILLTIIVLLSFSCSNNADKIQLGNNYKISDNSYLSNTDFIDKDFSILLTVKLDKKVLEQIISEVKRRPCFNKLGAYKK